MKFCSDSKNRTKKALLSQFGCFFQKSKTFSGQTFRVAGDRPCRPSNAPAASNEKRSANPSSRCHGRPPEFPPPSCGLPGQARPRPRTRLRRPVAHRRLRLSCRPSLSRLTAASPPSGPGPGWLACPEAPAPSPSGPMTSCPWLWLSKKCAMHASGEPRSRRYKLHLLCKSGPFCVAVLQHFF